MMDLDQKTMPNQIQNQFSVAHGQSEVKPRLKWTSDLHQKFVEAVNQLGGPEKATPKTVMRVMGVPGLTLYHLKSHLQKYRLGKNQNRIETRIEDNKKDSQVADRQSTENRDRLINDSDKGWRKTDINDLQIAKALHLQMEVQKKLHDQIEVQRHLQLRIEAQGKYLQSVLKKAQEALAGYNSPAAGLEAAKEELSELLSLVDSECPSSSISGSIEFSDKNTTNQLRTLVRPQTNDSSQESCLTSFEFSEKKDGRTSILQTDSEETNESNKNITLPLMEVNPISGEKLREKIICKIETEKISEESISARISFQQDDDNRSPKFRLSQELDLNV